MMRWRGFKLLRAGLPLAAVAIEFCWVFPWILLLTGVFYGRASTPLLPAWAVLVLLMSGFLVFRVATSARPVHWARGGVSAAGLLAGLIAVKTTYYQGYALWDLRWVGVLLQGAHDAFPVVVPSVVGALTATALWWRGVVLGEREFTHPELERGFRRGVGWSVGFVLIYALYSDSAGLAMTGPAGTYLLGFVSLSLITLAVARLVEIWEESQADEGQALAMNRHWLLLLVILVGLIFLVATLLSGFISVDFWSPLLALLRPLEPLVEFVFLIVFAVASVVARAILFVLAHFRPLRPPVARPPTENDPFAVLLRRLQELTLPARLVSSARWGVVVAVVLVLIVLVALAVVRARRRQRHGDEDERESVWSTRAALLDLGAFWRALWQQRRTGSGVDEDGGSVTIRALYRDLLRLGADLGVPRLSYQTPHEYLPRIRGRLPELAPELGSMTDTYVRVRYTPHMPSSDEIAATRSALERIRRRSQLNDE